MVSGTFLRETWRAWRGSGCHGQGRGGRAGALHRGGHRPRIDVLSVRGRARSTRCSVQAVASSQPGLPVTMVT